MPFLRSQPAPGEGRLAAATSAPKPARICTDRSCWPGRTPNTLPAAPHQRAHTPSRLARRHALALPPWPAPHAAATPDSPRVPNPESEVSATAPRCGGGN